MDTVSFRFDAHGGFAEVMGLAKLDDLGLELQFTTRDAVFGVVKTGQRSLRVPLEVLMSVRYRAGFLWLMPVIELRVNDLKVLDGLPESEEGRVRMRIKWRDRQDARDFVKELEMLRSHVRIQQLDRSLDRLSSQLPPRSSEAAPLPPAPPLAVPPTAPAATTPQPRPSQSES
jgi:hypothetical protein